MIRTTLVSPARGLAAALAVFALAGCGLAETGASAATQAESAAEQAKQGKALEEKVEQDVDAAQEAHAEALQRAEAAAQ
jgi:hypothetical protein